jgi:nitric oxide reductase subunit C
MNRKLVRLLFFVLITAYTGYTVHLYLKQESVPVNCNIQQAAKGRLVWQKYNCQSCHQIFGLGGYLGPDLTNVYSALYKGQDYIKGFVYGGTSQMPPFALNDSEMVSLIEFLKLTDASGNADPRNFIVQQDGMIKPK